MGRGGLDAASALEAGVLTREKVEGVWLFAASERTLTDAEQRVHDSASAVCTSWLLAPVPWLVGAVTKELAGRRVTREAVQAHVRGELRSGDLYGLALLTQEYQPYFAAFRSDDLAEVQRQLDEVRSQLSYEGSVRPEDLPQPTLPRESAAWRSIVLQHAEFLGLGRLVDSTLVGWCR
jgi:hypothetical protein